MRLWIEDLTQKPIKQEIELSKHDEAILRKLMDLNPELALCIIARKALHNGLSQGPLRDVIEAEFSEA